MRLFNSGAGERHTWYESPPKTEWDNEEFKKGYECGCVDAATGKKTPLLESIEYRKGYKKGFDYMSKNLTI